jgi:hypothetical protein
LLVVESDDSPQIKLGVWEEQPNVAGRVVQVPVGLHTCRKIGKKKRIGRCIGSAKSRALWICDSDGHMSSNTGSDRQNI